jgi:hypothetical protein
MVVPQFGAEMAGDLNGTGAAKVDGNTNIPPDPHGATPINPDKTFLC